MSEEKSSEQGFALDQKSIDVLVANIIPTTKYFEARFDHLQYQVDEIKTGQKQILSDMELRFEQVDKRFVDMKTEMDKRFEQVDKRFVDMKNEMDRRFVDMKTEMDKRFEQVDKRFVDMKNEMDKRFEQVDRRFVDIKTDMDKRFSQVDEKLDKILDRIDRRIDEGLRENRAQAMRMFTFAMTFSAISMIGLIGKFLKLY